MERLRHRACAAGVACLLVVLPGCQHHGRAAGPAPSRLPVLAAADDILAINDTLTAQYDGTGPKVVETTASSTTGSIWVVCLGPGRMTVRADEAGVSSTSTYRRCDGRPAGSLGGIDADLPTRIDITVDPDTMWRIFVVGTDISWRG